MVLSCVFEGQTATRIPLKRFASWGARSFGRRLTPHRIFTSPPASRRCIPALIAGVLALSWSARSFGDDGVTIRADPLASGTRDDEAASSLVRRSALDGAGQSASDVLRRQVGVGISETGGYGALSTAAIRGATSAQTSLFLAGLRLNDDLTGDADLSRVPLWMIGQIEVYRGAVPLEADPWGIGGAIFLDPRVPTRTEGSVSLTGGSFGTREVEARVGFGEERASALIGVRGAKARNDYSFVNDQGTHFDMSDDREERRRNTDASDVDAWALGRVKLGQRTRASLTSNEFLREQGIAGLAVAGAKAVRARTRRSLHGVEVTTECGTGCTVTGSSGLVLSSSAYDDPHLELAGGQRYVTLDGRRAETAGRIAFRGGVFEGGAYVRVSRESLATSALATERIEQQRHRDSARVAASAGVRQPAFGRAVIMGTLERQSTVSDDTAEAGRLFGAARLAASRSFGGAALSLNAGSYFRAPTLGELYGFSGVVRGNPSLRAEQGLMTDLGVRLGQLPPLGELPWTRTRIRPAFAGFLFARQAADLVAFRRSSLGYVTPYNLGDARVVGAELEGRVNLGTRLALAGGVTLLDARDTGRAGRNDLLPFRSRLKSTLLAEARFDGPDFLGAKTTTITVTHIYESSRYADSEGLIVIPDQATLDARVAVMLLGDHASFDIRLRNILDATRFDTVGFVLPGRAIFAAMEVFL